MLPLSSLYKEEHRGLLLNQAQRSLGEKPKDMDTRKEGKTQKGGE